MTFEEMQVRTEKYKNELSQIDKQIDNTFLHLLKRQDLVMDRNRDWGSKTNYLQIIYDEFNLEDFEKTVTELQRVFQKRREIRYEQNKLEKLLDVELYKQKAQME